MKIGLGLLMSRRRGGGGSPPPPAFSPADLSPTAWFSPNTPDTVYQNGNAEFAGVVGQPVGLVFDLSQGLAFGPNLIDNPGPFTDTSSWVSQRAAALSVVGSKLRVAGTGTDFPFASDLSTTVVNTYYLMRATSAPVSGPGNDIFVEKSDTEVANTNIAKTGNGGGRVCRVFFRATSTSTYTRLIAGGTLSVVDWDEVSLRSLSGIPALQSTAANRPLLGETVGGVKFLQNVSSDTIAWTAPAGTYTVAYVDSAGVVTILTGQSLSGATNIMLATELVEYVAYNRALTGGETADLTAYLEGVANP